MDTVTDLQYVHLILEGDNNAFALLVDRYKDMVFTLSVKMLKDKLEAEEVAQDTFVKVFKSLSKFNGESKFSTWIYKVAYNTCLDRLRKNKRLQPIAGIDRIHEEELSPLLNALDAIEDKERKQMIQDCLQKLPGEESFLLTLYYFEEQSLEEIAKIIGITPNNVKIRLYRSRRKLATLIKNNLEPEISAFYEREQR